ncbi:MAG: hypothetical protein GX248_08905 [Peptococcaceae bacterium]|mgnify:CR=1 FL=1|nr:hypothetical protein [Peptococcaceae bacterium]
MLNIWAVRCKKTYFLFLVFLSFLLFALGLPPYANAQEQSSGFYEPGFIQPAKADFNLNGSQDIIHFKGKNKESQLQVIDGEDGSVLWTYQGVIRNNNLATARNPDQTPVCVVEDLNNDGIPELAVSKAAEAGRGLIVEIFDIAGGWAEPYNTFSIQELPAEELNRNWGFGLSLQHLSWPTASYLAVSAYGGKDEQGMLIIYDYKKGQPVAFLPQDYYQITTLANADLLAADNQGRVHSFKIINDGPSVQVEKKEAKFSFSPYLPVKLEWENHQAEITTRIYIDNVFVLETNQESAELKIEKGEHLIGIAQYSPHGEVTLQLVEIHSVNNKAPIFLSLILIAIGLGGIFGLPRLIKLYLRTEGKNV